MQVTLTVSDETLAKLMKMHDYLKGRPRGRQSETVDDTLAWVVAQAFLDYEYLAKPTGQKHKKRESA